MCSSHPLMAVSALLSPTAGAAADHATEMLTRGPVESSETPPQERDARDACAESVDTRRHDARTVDDDTEAVSVSPARRR